MHTDLNESHAFPGGFINKLHIFSPTLNQIWWSLPLFAIVVRGFLAPIVLLDIYWHLRLGQVIVETLSIPRTDIFSFTAAGKLFVEQSWLSDVLLYWVYKAAGFPGLTFINGALLFMLLLPVLYLCKKTVPMIWPSIFSLLLVAFCIPWNLRPQVFSSVLFSFFYLILWSYRSRTSAAIYALPLMMILWVNLHGAFVMGLVLIAIFLFMELLELLNGRPHDAFKTRRLKILGMILFLCLIASLANPEFYKVYDYVLTIMNAASVQKYVTEWQPPVINTSDGFVMFYLPFILLTGAFIISNRRPTLIEIMLYFIFGAYGLTSLRNCVWFLIVSTPLLARHLSNIQWSAMLPWAESLILFRGKTRPKQRSFLNRIVASAMLLVLVVQSPWAKVKLRNMPLQSADTPIGAMDFIEGNKLKGNIFHPQIYGDYLIWRLWPQQRSFFDGRVHLFDEAFIKDYSKIFICADWENVLKKYDIKFLLLPKDKKDQDMTRIIQSARVSGRWALRYEDKLSVIFQKLSDPQ